MKINKLSLLLLSLLIINNQHEVQGISFASILDVGSIISDVVGIVCDVANMFITQKMAPDHLSDYKKYYDTLKGDFEEEQEIYDDISSDDFDMTETSLSLENLVKNVKSLGTEASKQDQEIAKLIVNVDTVIRQVDILAFTVHDELENRLRKAAKKIDNKFKLNRAMDDLVKYTNRIDELYLRLINHFNKIEELNPESLRSLRKTITSLAQDNPLDILDKMCNLFTPRRSLIVADSILTYFVKDKNSLTFQQRCDLTSTHQDQLKSIYNMVMITELRAFLIMTIAYRQSEIEQKSYHKNETDVNVQLFMDRSRTYLESMKKALAMTPSEIMRCDPTRHIKDHNSFEMTLLFGSYYMNVAQLDKSCSDSCESIDTKRQLECIYFDHEKYHSEGHSKFTITPSYCPRFPCHGRLHNCRTSNNNHLCEARIDKESRYKWIKNGVNSEMIQGCDGSYINTFTKMPCSSCICECSEEGAESVATRAVSFIPQFSDVKNNMVVTNVRFQKKDNMLHVQIQEGKLLPEGRVNRSTLQWVKLDDLEYRKNTPEGSFVKLTKDDEVPLVLNTDYAFLNNDYRTVWLDDITVNKDYVVTGVRFNYIILSGAISIELYSTKFDYFSGELSPNEESNEWTNANRMATRDNNYNQPRSEVDLSNCDDPLKKLGNDVMSKTNQLIKFQMADFKKTSGQVVIPFIDARPAGISGHTALTGVGIFHRGARGFGGFLAPRLIGMDHSKYLRMEISQDKINSYKPSFQRDRYSHQSQ
ncbi:uncharacterized protein LOC130672935 [Microplitis mediator]|uniref:uncharacterized protein LOC130672935 n=1 Tax=Microplitis mediator TaxID=375433 RepID=UPI002556CDE7|nr:uncharacterized protein LOC130672935 [Microplitis mediator]